MNRLLELPMLILVNIIVSIKGFFEYLRVVFRYYSNREFRRADLALLRSYLFVSPYRIHKNFMKSKGETDIYLYGETYITAFAEMADKAGIKPTDTYVELGCGRGRTCFWVHAFKKCTTVGIEYVPAFVEKAQEVIKKYVINGISFSCQNYLTEPLPNGTVYYIDATLSEGEEIVALIKLFDSLPKGIKVIAVNMSLTGDFPEQRPQWQELDTFTIAFPWGNSEVSIFQKK